MSLSARLPHSQLAGLEADNETCACFTAATHVVLSLGSLLGCLCAQVHLHGQMRKQANELLQGLKAARVHEDDAFEQGVLA